MARIWQVAFERGNIYNLNWVPKRTGADLSSAGTIYAMWKTTEGSTGRLIQLCLAYFLFYVITGVAVKYFTGHAELGYPGMKQIEYLVFNTIGGSLICLGVVLALRWYKLQSNKMMTWGSVRLPGGIPITFPPGASQPVVLPTPP